MKKTVVLADEVGRMIEHTRGMLMTKWGKDIGFSRLLNFLVPQGLRRLSELDEDAFIKQLEVLRLSKEKMDIEESIGELEHRFREKLGRIVISSNGKVWVKESRK